MTSYFTLSLDDRADNLVNRLVIAVESIEYRFSIQKTNIDHAATKIADDGFGKCRCPDDSGSCGWCLEFRRIKDVLSP